MDWDGIAGMPITPKVASAAMAMVTARTEPNYLVTAFSSSATPGHGYPTWGRGGSEDGITALDITPKMRLDDIVRKVSGLPFGGTDCSLPMLHALEKKIPIDTFVVYTDNETWAGNIHPHQALERYRQATGRNAKLIVVGMTATDFTIADPNDAGMLDVVGFNTAAPRVMADFARE
jgi:60 kDa SS-A/Ro ribonucleoprotein